MSLLFYFSLLSFPHKVFRFCSLLGNIGNIFDLYKKYEIK